MELDTLPNRTTEATVGLDLKAKIREPTDMVLGRGHPPSLSCAPWESMLCAHTVKGTEAIRDVAEESE